MTPWESVAALDRKRESQRQAMTGFTQPQTGARVSNLLGDLGRQYGTYLHDYHQGLVPTMPSFEILAAMENAQPGNTDLTPAISGALDLIPQAKVAMPLMTAWHGSPHLFNRFDMSKIGTGEGAQAYGHGLYLAENPTIAGHYATALGGGNTLPRKWTGEGVTAVRQAHGLDEKQVKTVFDMAEAALKDQGDNALRGVEPGTPYYDALSSLTQKSAVRSEPHVYKVDLPDEAVNRMLDWDKPLSEQPESVRRALNSLPGEFPERNRYGEQLKGRELYDLVKAKFSGLGFKSERNRMGLGGGYPGGADEALSMYLNQQGIPGIRYLDATSRGAGEGTRNFVIFDDSLATIMERNGIKIGQ